MKPWRIFLLLCLLLLSATGLFARPAKAYSPNLYSTRVGGYGPLLGYDAPALTLSGSLADSLVWRTRRVDPSGFYWMGARYYEPVSGRFLSPDPAGHGGSWDLYSFANGDPINQFDPDGRLGKNAFVGATAGDFATTDTGWGGMFGQTLAGCIPIYGQIGDARDTGAAFRNMSNGGWKTWSAWFGLGAAGVAWIPGLDFLKSADNVVRQLDNVPASGFSPSVPHGGGGGDWTPDWRPGGSDAPYNPRDIRQSLENTYGANNVSSTTVPPSSAPNVSLAGSRHPDTGIVFDNRGFPIFDDVSAFDTRLPSQQFNAASYSQQMQMASQAMWASIQRGEVSANRFTSHQLQQIQSGAAKIDDFTWHHHQDLGRMQLVPADIHKRTGHIGGASMSEGR